jgi:hypothetical protein
VKIILPERNNGNDPTEIANRADAALKEPAIFAAIAG